MSRGTRRARSRLTAASIACSCSTTASAGGGCQFFGIPSGPAIRCRRSSRRNSAGRIAGRFGCGSLGALGILRLRRCFASAKHLLRSGCQSRVVYSHCMRAILAGGGTGGHVIPALAIANELKKRYGAEVLFIGTARGIENRLVPAAGFPLCLVQVGALKNVSLKTRLKTLFDLPRAVWDSRRILAEFQPDVVIGVGGYASGPAMLAAILRGTPTLAFEPNVVPGFANRMVARWVSGAAVHFEETARYFRNAEVTGVPVREAFFHIAGHATANA